MEPKNCDHGIPDGVGCVICDTDGAVEACGFDRDCYISGGLPSPDGMWIEPSSSSSATKIAASPSIPLAVITPRVEYLINPNPSQSDPPTSGLEVSLLF